MLQLPRPELVAFIDESGDFELNTIDPNYPVCAQCALTCTVDEYLDKAVPNLMKVKYSFFGNECVVMHGHKIRKRSAPFDILRDADVQNEFMDALSWAINELSGCIIVAAVHKERHVNQYISPNDPFFLSLQFLLERLYMHWSAELAKGKRLTCIFEQRGAVEDRKTLAWFNAICAGDNRRRQQFPFDADFRPKDQNVIGHQYADLVAYAACRYVQTGNEDRLDWQAVKGKLRQVDGRYQGHGLKVFP